MLKNERHANVANCSGSKKSKLHLGFGINQGSPQTLFLTDGKSNERPFVHDIIKPGQTSEVRLVGYVVEWDKYWVATRRFAFMGLIVGLIRVGRPHK